MIIELTRTPDSNSFILLDPNIVPAFYLWNEIWWGQKAKTLGPLLLWPRTWPYDWQKSKEKVRDTSGHHWQPRQNFSIVANDVVCLWIAWRESVKDTANHFVHARGGDKVKSLHAFHTCPGKDKLYIRLEKRLCLCSNRWQMRSNVVRTKKRHTRRQLRVLLVF